MLKNDAKNYINNQKIHCEEIKGTYLFFKAMFSSLKLGFGLEIAKLWCRYKSHFWYSSLFCIQKKTFSPLFLTELLEYYPGMMKLLFIVLCVTLLELFNNEYWYFLWINTLASRLENILLWILVNDLPKCNLIGQLSRQKLVVCYIILHTLKVAIYTE